MMMSHKFCERLKTASHIIPTLELERPRLREDKYLSRGPHSGSQNVELPQSIYRIQPPSVYKQLFECKDVIEFKIAFIYFVFFQTP